MTQQTITGEKMASLVHDVWARWIIYMSARCVPQPDGALTIPAEFVQRWSRQARTLYPYLSESEKQSDRDIAADYMRLGGFDAQGVKIAELEQALAACYIALATPDDPQAQP